MKSRFALVVMRRAILVSQKEAKALCWSIGNDRVGFRGLAILYLKTGAGLEVIKNKKPEGLACYD